MYGIYSYAILTITGRTRPDWQTTYGCEIMEKMNAKFSCLVVTESSANGYRQRTIHNTRSAGLTAAFAVNFETAGERLTRSAAGTNYVAIPLSEGTLTSARLLYRALKHFDSHSLNIAGNGIHTLSTRNWHQDGLNAHLFEIISTVHKHWPLEKIVSGGQTGVDLAGLVCAFALDIPCVGTLPKGFLQRGVDGKDFENSAAEIRKQIENGAAALVKNEQELRSERPGQ